MRLALRRRKQAALPVGTDEMRAAWQCASLLLGYPDDQLLGHLPVLRETLPNGNVASGQAWAINLRRPDFQDIRVREALGLMFNFEWANKSLFYGLYTRTGSFWDNSDLAASGPPSAQERAILEPLAADLPAGILTDDAISPPVSGERQLDRGNLRRAAALLL